MTQPIDALSAKATAIASQGAAARKLDTTLAKLTAATAVKPAAPTPALGDAASLTDANVLKAVRDTAPLRELGSRLIDLRKLLASPPQTKTSTAAQSALDKVAASIDAVAGKPPVQTSLAFDGAYLDLDGETNNALAQFRLELSGPRGVQELSFTSGTSVADIAATIDLVGEDLAVSARVSGNAVVIEAESRDGQELAGVRVLDPAGANLIDSESSALDALSGLLTRDLASIETERVLPLLDDAIREVERAEREELLARAGGEITLDDSEIPVIREAQAKLLEEARRLGLLVDHDPAKAFDALRG